MKLVIAIIQPTKLKAVQEALAKVGVERMTVCDAQGYGRQRGQSAVYRGIEYQTNLLRKIELEILVNDDFLERTVNTIESVARTGPDGNIGDGKIFVVPAVRDLSHWRLGERAGSRVMHYGFTKTVCVVREMEIEKWKMMN